MIHRIAILDCAQVKPCIVGLIPGPATCVPSATTQTSLPLCMQRDVHVQRIGCGLRSSLFLSRGQGLSKLRPRSRRAGGGDSHAGGHDFFYPAIVQAKIECLQSDFQALLRLGRKFGQFDRQGKVSYVDEMKKMVERWQIVYTRMELSGDSSAKRCAAQLRTAVGPLGLSDVDLAKSLMLVLDEMRQDAESGH
ncbi:hypothetical protein O6H91_15G063500 [Diphasiastrum complanatum]|uniref:Uncharacterized protein n=1 Tax=Diphasiastrum complanatum TaxID=34168 RepID=A0ACC2BJ23_DIPCM|nr:hypothetical protein O6H91_15G063500 [Diphasiastrum complanatum]